MILRKEEREKKHKDDKPHNYQKHAQTQKKKKNIVTLPIK
jgi:hypothetical protein